MCLLGLWVETSTTDGSPSQQWRFDVLQFSVSLKKLLNKQLSCRWFEKPQRLCDVIVMTSSWTVSLAEASCGGVYSDPDGLVKSPNFPSNYDVDLDCVYTITILYRHQVALKFKEFDLEGGVGCPDDYLVVSIDQDLNLQSRTHTKTGSEVLTHVSRTMLALDCSSVITW